jgi:WD40 repeat protein
MTARLSRRLGLLLGLAVALFLIAGVQAQFNRLSRLRGPAALEPVAHEGATTLAFSEDGGCLLSLDPAGRLRRWSLRTGTHEEESLRGRGIYEGRSLFADPGGRLCVANAAGAAYALLLRPGWGAWRVPGLVWGAPSCNGRFVFGGERGGRVLSLYDARSRKFLDSRLVPDRKRLSLSVDLSPDGRWLAGFLGGRQSGVPCVLPVARPETRVLDSAAWTGQPWLEFSPDGRYLGLLRDDHARTFRLLSVSDWKRAAEFPLHGGRKPLFRFSNDSRFIAAPVAHRRSYLIGSLWLEQRREDVQALQVFEAATGRPLLEWGDPAAVRGHRSPVVDCAWSPENEVVATLDQDGRIALWDVPRRRFVTFLRG